LTGLFTDVTKAKVHADNGAKMVKDPLGIGGSAHRHAGIMAKLRLVSLSRPSTPT
jgi:hypothetical protein